MRMSTKLCNQCPLSTTKLLGVECGILRCGVCGCSIKLKGALGGQCPKFETLEEMLAYKKSLQEPEK